MYENLDEQFKKTEPAPQGGFQVVPEGTECHLAIVDQAPHTTHKEAGDSLSLMVVFEVVLPEEYAGTRIWKYMGVSEKNLKYLKRDLGLIGWKGEKISPLMSKDNSDLIGLGCLAVLGIETSGLFDNMTGVTRTKTKNVIKFIKEPWQMPHPQKAQARPGAGASAPQAGGSDEPPF
jgi:hypothetical protein